MPISNEFIKELQDVTTKEQIYEFLQDLTLGLGLDYFLFATSFPLSLIKSDLVMIDNYREGWRELYDIDQLVQTGPLINYCRNNHSPIFWGKGQTPELQLLNKQLFTVHQSGVAVPLHGPGGAVGMLNLSASRDKGNCELILSEALPIIQIVIPYLQDALLGIKREQDTEGVQLTSREIECLTWATEGKSAWEISQILGCSERTVTFHLNNATAKLNCSNRYQAIAKAILTGVITPSI